MAGFANILIASDFSERAERAEKRAAALCTRRPCTANLLTVIESDQLGDFARMMNTSPDAARADVSEAALRELRARSGKLFATRGGEVTCFVRFGRPAIEISRQSEESSSDLVVIGAQGGHFFSDIFVGNTADRLIRRCTRPLLIVKNDSTSAYGNILVPVDFSEDSKRAAQLALAIDADADITFLHVYDVPMAGKMAYAGYRATLSIITPSDPAPTPSAPWTPSSTSSTSRRDASPAPSSGVTRVRLCVILPRRRGPT